MTNTEATNSVSGRSGYCDAPDDPWATPERRALGQLARSFVAREIAPEVTEWEQVGEVPRELHRKAADVGLLGVGFSEQVGGSGGDALDSALVTEAILAGGGSTGVCAALFTHGIALPHIAANGSDALIDRYVRPTLAGEMIGSLAVTEPGAGSDVANLRTRAVRDGDTYVVNGAKTFITSGVRADFVTTAVRTGGPGYGGVSLLVIDKGTPGFEVSRRLDKMGWRCSDTAELSFVDVRVPAGNLVGAENSGFVQIMQQFQAERLGIAVQAYATAERALALATEVVERARARGFSVRSPVGRELSAVVHLGVPDAPRDLEARLRRSGVVVRVIGDDLRVSPHFWNTPGDLDTLFAALSQAL